MGTKLSPQEMELYRRVDEVLHYLWDPCGISDAPQARDEYNGYLPAVFNLVKGGADALAVASHLANIERTRMELAGDTSQLLAIGELLVEWRLHIIAQHS